MNSTMPIVLKKHISHSQAAELQDSGIQIVFVDSSMIANCRTDKEETRVNALNATLPKKVTQQCYWPKLPRKQFNA